jgi:tetratricopeptide (TPR) repeat protein
MKKIILALFLLLGSLSLPAQVNTDRVMLIGRNALYFEDYVLAIQYFNQVISAKPYLADPYYYRGLAKFMLDDFKGAEDDCTLCLERNPYWMAAYQLRAAARQNQEKFTEAAEDYRRSLEFFPEDKLTLVNMGIVQMQMKKYDEAKKYFDELIHLFPDYIPGYLARAHMHLEKKDTTAALADYDKAIEIDPYTSQSFAARGLLHYQLKEYNKALADLDEAIRLDPYFEGNYINRGLVKYNLNDLRGAMADYDRVLEMDANNLIARFNRGLLRAQVGDNNRAIEDFDKVLELEPANTIAYLNRALLNNEINNYEGALADLNVVLRKHPDFFQGYYMRSELKRKMGDLAGAEKDFYLARNEEAEFGKKSEDETNPAKLNENTQPKETRETTDNDIEKFNMLVVADKETEQKTNYRNRSRGKVQNINARVELQPKFVLTYYEKPYEVQRPVYFLKELDKANHESGLAWKLRITNNEAGLNELQIQTHFRSINNYSKQIDNEPNNAMLYFGRGMDYMLVQDYANALQDINTTISLKPDMTIAYFARAVIRSKQMEVDAMAQQQDGLKGGDSPLKIKLPSRNEKFTGQNLPKVPEVSKEIIGYDAILKDYEKILQIDPDFFYAYYNRAEIYTIEKDYRAAINDYTEAIKREPNFAEAYFNRGLARLSIGESTAGLDDLRKAGELGIVESYSIIKRMQ